MMVLFILRKTIKKEIIKTDDLAKLSHGLYPATEMDELTGEYTASFDSIAT